MPNYGVPMPTDPGNLAVYWGARIAAALLILLVAHFVAKGVKWAIAKGVDRLPVARHHVEATAGASKESVGSRLGAVGYWLVLLIGVIAALNVLELSGVVEPLNAMLIGFFAYIPNIVGALVIFFVGLLVATPARRLVEAALQAADVDRWLAKAGGRTGVQTAGLSKVLSTVVFVLIIVPVAIAALQVLGIEAISVPAIAVLTAVLAAVPKIIAAALVLTVAYVIGRWVASLIEGALPALGFDRAIHSMTAVSTFTGGQGGVVAPATPAVASPSTPAATGETSFIGSTPVTEAEVAAAPGGATPVSGAEASARAAVAAPSTPSKILATIVLVGIMWFSAIEAAKLLGFDNIAAILQEVLALAGRVLFGGVIIALGVMIAEFLSKAIDSSTEGRDGFASVLVKWATIALATAMGLRFMGLADDIVTLAFGLILGSAAVAAALAFGLGGREVAGKLLDKWTKKAQAAPPPQ